MCLCLEKTVRVFQKHLTSYNDLITPYEAIRAGFIEIALEKNRTATPFVEEAKALRSAAYEAKKAEDLLNISHIYSSLLTAAGLSDKALSHLSKEDKQKAIEDLIENFLIPAGKEFVDELVYRFLLTKGDALGGMMRNLAGKLGERKFSRSVIATLSVQKIKCFWLHKKSKEWIVNTKSDVENESYLRGIAWSNDIGDRTLLFNITVPNVRKNVDLCLLKCHYKELGDKCKNIKHIINVPKNYIALGELKGGIDPAGADEHWKTANTALSRIREAFAQHKLTPKTFFIGAANERIQQEILNF